MLVSDVNIPSEDIQWCDVCRSHVANACDDCHTPFSKGQTRYRSQTYHFHPATIGGVAGTRAVQKELCVDCYRKDYAKAYPNEPVPELPDTGVDANFHAAQVRERKLNNLLALINKCVPPLTEGEATQLSNTIKNLERFL